MTLRHEFLISVFSIFVIFLIFSPLTLFLQDLAKGHIYFKFEAHQNEIILTLVNEGTSYLKDIVYNATAQDIFGNIYNKSGKIDTFQKGDQISITIPLKVPSTLIVNIDLKLAATINGLYRFSFEVKRG
ncbi:MAG TPA: hypothetical protein VKU94_05675 [Geobacterales bacterium]|nr:hypothetical protein [Geobacterales bacterium]